MSAKIQLLIPNSLVWCCPVCNAINAKGMLACRCGKKLSPGTVMVDPGTPVGASWICPQCMQSNAHTRTRCACNSDRPRHAVVGKDKDGQAERRGRVPIMEKFTKAEARFLREQIEPHLGSTIRHVIPQVKFPFPDGTAYHVDFMCIMLDGTVKCYEVKGNYSLKFAWAEQGVERFRRAKDMWPGLNFEMWKREKTGKNGKGVDSWVRHI